MPVGIHLLKRETIDRRLANASPPATMLANDVEHTACVNFPKKSRPINCLPTTESQAVDATSEPTAIIALYDARDV
jgi:hypothetical protein